MQLQDHFSICPTCVYALLPAAPPPPAYEEAPPCSYKLTATNALLWQITTKVVPYFCLSAFLFAAPPPPAYEEAPPCSYKLTATNALPDKLGRLWGYDDGTGASCVFNGQSLGESNLPQCSGGSSP